MSTAAQRPVAVIGLAAIAAIEGIALLGYAVFDTVEGLRQGATGPADVSNVPAIILLVAILVIFGLGLVWVARGWWRLRRAARAPFLLAQVLAVLVGYELAQSEGAVERTVGIAMALVAVVGIVLCFLPPVTRALEP